MSFIQVKNVPPDVHDALRRRAADEGMTVSAYVLGLIERDLALPSRRQWLLQLARRHPVEVDAAAALDAARAERDGELLGS